MEERSASDNEAPAAQESPGPERPHAPHGSPASVRSAASGGPPATARLLAADEPEASVRSQARAKSKALEAAHSLGPSPPAADDDDIVVVFAGTPAVVPGPVAGACGLTVLCLILLSDGYRLEVNQNVTAMHFPFIVFSSFTLITGVILLGYIMGMKMRELLGMIEEGDTDELGFSVTSIPRRRICFVAQVLLSFVASVVYLSDVVFSYRRTMRMLN
ncbi:Protein of unknown function [Gryllus bimaculatus]|nr:Protein of unknown function [Gryllus bimaculatus]